MNNVELYEKSNTLQIYDAIKCLEKYTKIIQWKRDAWILDIGSGDGKVTKTVLKKYLPRCARIVGCDKNEDMVEFANRNNASGDTSFEMLDIEGEIPCQMLFKFQYAFSFYALHWTRNPGIVFKNIYDLLAEEGACLLMFLGHLSYYTAMRHLARNSRWSPWLKDLERTISPYHDCEDPVQEIKSSMYNIGFTYVEAEYQPKTFAYDSYDDRKRAFRAINVFKVPEELFDEFMEDILEEMSRIDISKGDIDHAEARKTFYYNLIYIYAKK